MKLLSTFTSLPETIINNSATHWSDLKLVLLIGIGLTLLISVPLAVRGMKKRIAEQLLIRFINQLRGEGLRQEPLRSEVTRRGQNRWCIRYLTKRKFGFISDRGLSAIARKYANLSRQ